MCTQVDSVSSAEKKSLSIYGYSQAYGQGDHDLAAKLAGEALGYSDIKVSYEGY